ncbi:hypothetical protein BDN72DRAFT_875376 [Pluteus cervinus]|uniref:Uncharacterized protein n=1 Tax=Pluteus cervinus TaxID=181527 RepID=A0ACD3B7K4_9AGAR|nr:hypothetical protein BDN72DRAFT_875376 [Pluteus cervinus]
MHDHSRRLVELIWLGDARWLWPNYHCLLVVLLPGTLKGLLPTAFDFVTLLREVSITIESTLKPGYLTKLYLSYVKITPKRVRFVGLRLDTGNLVAILSWLSNPGCVFDVSFQRSFQLLHLYSKPNSIHLGVKFLWFISPFLEELIWARDGYSAYVTTPWITNFLSNPNCFEKSSLKVKYIAMTSAKETRYSLFETLWAMCYLLL